MHHDIVDLFAGPGGWDHGARDAGVNPDRILGIEWDADACATARAAGYHRLQADIAALEPCDFGPIVGLIGSPPCQSYSTAGKQKGRRDRAHVEICAENIAWGFDTRHLHREDCEDPRSLLTVEPLRWALQLRPEWIVLEQVPAVLPLWQRFAEILRANGYSAEAGVVTAEQYGVPQTRKRAILVASRVRDVALPVPTHQAYDGRKHGPKAGTEHLLPYVTLEAALGYDPTERVGFPRRADDQPSVVINGAAYRERDFRSGDEPAFGLTEKARSWQRFTLRSSAQAHATVRHSDEPAPTITGGHDHAERVFIPESTQRLQQPGWGAERPATTVAGDARLFQPGGHHVAGQQSHNAVRMTLAEALQLQTFPADYPVTGTRTAQFLQVGNAVPPVLAAAVLGAVV